MKMKQWIAAAALFALSAAMSAQTNDTQVSVADGQMSEVAQLEKSREAGLLTDWHMSGHFGHSGDFAHRFAPEKEAAKQAQKTAPRHFERRRYELVFPEGTFALPKEMTGQNGVFYAVSSTYLTSGGDWNVYLESGAEAVVFVDGHRVLARGAKATGALRGKIHIESGYHLVMVKFTAEAAPFRVAILPPNSGSKRKNNTPYLQASPASEDMMAGVGAMGKFGI
jgi:hypothetical protein